jgi:hypothetical protein
MSEQNKRVVMSFIKAMGQSDPETAAKCLATEPRFQPVDL